jgi:hypothetical protein
MAAPRSVPWFWLALFGGVVVALVVLVFAGAGQHKENPAFGDSTAEEREQAARLRSVQHKPALAGARAPLPIQARPLTIRPKLDLGQREQPLSPEVERSAH